MAKSLCIKSMIAFHLIFTVFTAVTVCSADRHDCSGAKDAPLDISSVANMGFKDEVANDGVGGWSDQGPHKDMNGLDLSGKNHEGINFNLIDPQLNKGVAVLTFKGEHTLTQLKTAEVKLKRAVPAQFIYLLHACCWNIYPKGTPLAAIIVKFTDGTSRQMEVKADIDVADWSKPGDLDNAKVVLKKLNNSFETGIYLSKFAIGSEGHKTVSSVAFETYGKATWIIVGATLSSRNIDIKVKTLKFAADDKWKAVDMSDVRIKAGSALDLSFLQDAPAGKHGRAVIGKDGSLEFEQRPGQKARLMGFTSPLRTFFIDYLKTQTHRENLEGIVSYAELVKRQGYNLVRPFLDIRLPDWVSPASCTFNRERLDLCDKLIAELKARGVYTYLIIASYRCGLKEGRRAHFTDKHALKPGMYLGDEELREHWKTLAGVMLNHVNPYTGLAWKDDPAVVCVEFYNEQEFGFYRIKEAPAGSRDMYDAKWNEWLTGKYHNSVNLADAWKISAKTADEKWGKLRVPDEGLNGRGPGRDDFSRFTRELAREQFVWYDRIVRGLGYKGLVTQYNLSKLIVDSAVRWEYSPVVSMNGYHCHASSFSAPGSKCSQISSVAVGAQYWRSANSTRLADRPFIVSEHNQYFWNQYQREDGLVFGAYSALQGFSGVIVHEGAVALEVKGPNDCTSVARSPVYRANEFITAFLYRRGDVEQARHRVELNISRDFMNRNGNGDHAVNSEQNKIGLLTGFSVAFPELKKPSNVPDIPAPDITLRPGQGARISVGDMFTDVVESGGKSFDLQRFIKTMKDRGILPAHNITNPAEGIYQSENGQITLRAKENLIKVVTPYTEGVTLKAGCREKLNFMTVVNSTVPAAVAAIPLDRKPLNESARIVIVYSTETVNTGMTVSRDRSILYDLGTLPVLLRCGKLEMSLERKNPNPSGMSLYALGMDGSRREKMSISASGNSLAIKLDTAMLKNGPTTFFELTDETQDHP